MNEKQKCAMLDKIDDMGWYIHVDDDGGSIELEKWTPAGEDFIFSIAGKDIAAEVKEYYEDFDPNEHAKMWVENMGTVNGVPKDIRTLIDDAEAIDSMLAELVDALLEMEV